MGVLGWGRTRVAPEKLMSLSLCDHFRDNQSETLDMDTEIEIWKPIVGWEGHYEVSNMGRVRNGDLRILRLTATSHGYRVVNTITANIHKGRYVHRLVATAFIQNPDGKPLVNHKNGVKSDNKASNLEWVTPLENNIHASEVLLATNGSKHWNAKLNDAKVQEIFDLYRHQETMDSIA